MVQRAQRSLKMTFNFYLTSLKYKKNRNKRQGVDAVNEINNPLTLVFSTSPTKKPILALQLLQVK